jgi:beta-lactamase class D
MTIITRRGVLAGAAAFAAMPFAGTGAANDIESFFGERTGTFVGVDLATGARDVANPGLGATPDAPFSTFKIWNSLIAVDAGVIEGAETVIQWDKGRDPPQDFWPESWKQDHTLASAYKNSCVWYYQELARRIGAERMQAKLNEVKFGNADISAGIDQFWLGSSLKISPEEQVAHLVKLAKRDVPFSLHAIDTLRTISVYEEKGTKTLRAKTGGGFNGRGWFVGWIEEGKTPQYAFALLIHGATFDDIFQPRIEISRRILAHLGRWPAE